MRRYIKITESQYKHFVGQQVDEVRYIDTYSGYRNSDKQTKKDPMQAFSQEPIKDTDKIRVYHGTDLKNAVLIAKEGVSGQQWTPRKHSYEAGMNPIGLFVSTDFYKVTEFANPFDGGKDKNAAVIIEFTAKASDLDTPVWNGQGTYFGQYSNPQPFRNKEERDSQRQKYHDDASNHEWDYVRNSDNPAMAKNIFYNNEHQALFLGNLDPNMIKRFWVKKYEEYIAVGEKRYIPMTRQQFLKEYGGTGFYSGYKDRKTGKDVYNPLISRKIYRPNDNFTGFEDCARRFIEYEKKDNPKAYQRQLKYYDGGEEGLYRHYMETFPELLEDEHWDYFKEIMWPKQLKQMLGDERYQEIFDRYGITAGR